MINTSLIMASRKSYGADDDIAAAFESERGCLYDYDKKIFSQKGDFRDKSGLCRKIIKGVIFSCLYIKGPSNSLHVSFSGAKRPDHNYITNPIIPRWTYHTLYDGCFLGLDDPMYYKYQGLNLGWYFGDKDRFYIRDSLDIIDEVMRLNEIREDSVTFFSSSGGGYAALMAALLRPGSLSISMNPQIYIHNWDYFPIFSSLTGIIATETDKFNRFNPLALLRESQSRHVLCFNIASRQDVETQLKPLMRSLNIKIRYGLNLYKNLLIWLYDAPGAPDAHTSFETKAIYCAIEHVANEFRKDGSLDLNKFQPFALLINEIWHDLYIVKKEYYETNEHLVQNNRELVAEINNLTEKLKGIYKGGQV